MPGLPAIRLLTTVGLQPGGTVRWRERIASSGPGVYVIETPEPLSEAPLDLEAIAAWTSRVPDLRVDGEHLAPGELANRLREFWIRDEQIVYIGLAGTSLRTRIGQFYRTPLGDRGPHAGGHWLKTLAGLATFRVSWAETDEPDRMEEELLVAFADRLSVAARAQLPNGPVLPFANLETTGKVRKAHGISGSRLARVTTVPRDVGVRHTPPAIRTSGKGTVDEINAALQRFACGRPERAVTAVEGGLELDRLGLLRDSAKRPGKPLRDRLRVGSIDNAYQKGGRFWFNRCSEIRGWIGQQGLPSRARLAWGLHRADRIRLVDEGAVDSRATSAMNRSTESAIARLYRSGPVKRPQDRPRGGGWYRVQGWVERAVTPAYTRVTATALDALWRRVGP